MELKEATTNLKLFETHRSVIFPTRIMRFKAQSIFNKFMETVKHIFNKSPKSEHLKMSEFFNFQNVYELFLPEGT